MDIFGNIIDRFSFKKIYIMVKGGINKLKQFNNRFSAVFDTSAEVCELFSTQFCSSEIIKLLFIWLLT